jgi:hypothetical protein
MFAASVGDELEFKHLLSGESGRRHKEQRHSRKNNGDKLRHKLLLRLLKSMNACRSELLTLPESLWRNSYEPERCPRPAEAAETRHAGLGMTVSQTDGEKVQVLITSACCGERACRQGRKGEAAQLEHARRVCDQRWM